MKVNYNEICKIYDDVREGEIQVINGLLDEFNFDVDSRILDIGCGTGNYTDIMQKITKSKTYGVDQSEGMLLKAREKNEKINFVKGDALSIPFENDFFDFIYMTDVIHHISDIDKMFFEIYRVLKPNGKVCISTQSHRQIDLRYMSYFFPRTSIVDKNRYPDIDEIVENAKKNRLDLLKERIVDEGTEVMLGEGFLELVEKRGYSMLHLISDEEFKEGLEKVKNELVNGSIKSKSAGGTMIWFKK